MPVNQQVSNDGKKVLINIKGRFDYRVSQQFRDTYRHLSGQDGVAYHVDLSDTDYMDSSALGMLLLLREHAKCRGGSVHISKPSEQVDKILKVANFEQLFMISQSSTG